MDHDTTMGRNEISSHEDDVNEKNEVSKEYATMRESIPVKVALAMARSPWKFLLGSLISAISLSIIGIVGGNFSISAENDGWRSRNTLLSNREIQANLVVRNRNNLFRDEDGKVWENLETNKKQGWDYDDGRRLSKMEGEVIYNGTMRQGTFSDYFSECDNWYRYDILAGDPLICTWKPEGGSSALEPEVLLEVCRAEQNTLTLIESKDACVKCDDECLPPQSLVLILREYLNAAVNGTLQMPCEDLINLYTSSIQSSFTTMLADCIGNVTESFDSETFNVREYGSNSNITSCPDNFPYIATTVDMSFSRDTEKVLYTSSFFPVQESKLDRLYDVVDDLDRGDDSIVSGGYDTMDEYFSTTLVDELIQTDMLLATASFFITMIAMYVHTRSPWLATIGILQIFLSIPLAYFVYYFIAQLKFFPFLNFIGVFVVAALGADDVFVAVDKWKNARKEHPHAKTEDIASIALPDAAGAMFLTTTTTCVAFFATAICPVAPVKCFAVFCGLLIFFDYALCVALIFPALCLYDKWILNGKANVCVVFCATKKQKEENDTESESNDKSLIHRILSTYYKYLHKYHYPILVIFGVGLAIFIYYASTFDLPESSDVRLLPEDHQFELNFRWKQMLSAQQYLASGGSSVRIIWGIKAEDNGNRNDPHSLSSLVLDNSFKPQSEESQIYLRDICSRLFENDFVLLSYEDYECPINSFDSWLQRQATLKTTMNSTSTEYDTSCDGASALPMASDSFDACFIAWSKSTKNIDVLAKNGKIKILIVQVKSEIYFSVPYSVMKKEHGNFENWVDSEKKIAPKGVDAMYHSSGIWWFYDTNRAMLQTALGAAGIAIGFSSLVVFMASRSLQLTLFSTIAIIYVLAATTACLIGLGWTLGFLESVCLAILIGISCDFVIHFSHAYRHYQGKRSCEDRTKFTVVHMGPSILAAAATTFSAALVMLFCRITFFTKFASILFFTMLHSTIGTFVGFLVLADLFGPSEPTRFVDTQLQKCFGKDKNSDKNVDDA